VAAPTAEAAAPRRRLAGGTLVLLRATGERQRISFHYNGGLNLDLGVVIDNSCMTSAECAASVLRFSGH
jgi:hypothetical protein